MPRHPLALAALALAVVTAFASPARADDGTCPTGSDGGGGGSLLGGFLHDVDHAVDAVGGGMRDGLAKATDFVGLHVLLTGHEQAVLRSARALPVPSEKQRAGECGLYALHDVMAYWHARVPSAPLPDVNTHVSLGERFAGFWVNAFTVVPGVGWFSTETGLDREGAGDVGEIRRTHRPGSLLGTAIAHGYTKGANEGTYPDALASLARQYGYRASAPYYPRPTVADLKLLLAEGRPPIVTFKVNHEGDPKDGTPDHFAVLTSISERNGTWYVTAVHGWSSKPFVWTLDDFVRSWGPTNDLVEVQPELR